MTGETFSVYQWFPDETWERVRQDVPPEEAVRAAIHYCTSVGAKMGTTVRVIIEDGGGSINWEWKRDQGIVYPPGPSIGRMKLGVMD